MKNAGKPGCIYPGAAHKPGRETGLLKTGKKKAEPATAAGCWDGVEEKHSRHFPCVEQSVTAAMEMADLAKNRPEISRVPGFWGETEGSVRCRLLPRQQTQTGSGRAHAPMPVERTSKLL